MGIKLGVGVKEKNIKKYLTGKIIFDKINCERCSQIKGAKGG